MRVKGGGSGRNRSAYCSGSRDVAERGQALSSAWGWIRNAGGSGYTIGYGAYGQLGDGSRSTRTYVVQVALSNVLQTATGAYHTLFRTLGGEVYGTGANSYGMLGIGGGSGVARPTRVLLSDVVHIAAGFAHSVFVTSDGGGYTCGYNSHGQLGDGSTSNRDSPVRVMSTGVVYAAAGYMHTVFILAGGQAYATGRNYYGQLGDGSRSNRYAPSSSMAGYNMAMVACGEEHTVFMTADGSAYAVGRNWQNYPTRTMSGHTVVYVSACQESTFFVTSRGQVYSQGSNYNGELGDGSTSSRSSPVQMRVPSSTVVRQLAQGPAAYQTFALSAAPPGMTLLSSINNTNSSNVSAPRAPPIPESFYGFYGFYGVALSEEDAEEGEGKISRWSGLGQWYGLDPLTARLYRPAAASSSSPLVANGSVGTATKRGGAIYADLSLHRFADEAQPAVALTAAGVAATGNAARSILFRLRTNSSADYCVVSTGSPAENRSFSVTSYGSQGRCIGVMGYLNDFHPGYRGYPAHCTPVNDGAWHHVAVTYDGEGKLSVYVDGVEDNRAEGKAYNTTGQENFLGRSHDEHYLDLLVGEVHGVAFYNRALSGDEVAAAAAGNTSQAVNSSASDAESSSQAVLVPPSVSSENLYSEAEEFYGLSYDPYAPVSPTPPAGDRPPPHLLWDHFSAPPPWFHEGLPRPPAPAPVRVDVLPKETLTDVTLRPQDSYVQEVELVNSGDRDVHFTVQVEYWSLLLDRIEASGAQGSAALLPFAQGHFHKVVAVWRDGWWGCSSTTECGQPRVPEWPWQACKHNCDSLRRPFSFELLKNGEYVVEQPAWGTLPPQCTAPINGTGDIVCDVDLVIAEGDTLTVTWYDVSHSAASSENRSEPTDRTIEQGTLTLDLMGLRQNFTQGSWTTRSPISSAPPVDEGDNHDADTDMELDLNEDMDSDAGGQAGTSLALLLDCKSAPEATYGVVGTLARAVITLNHSCADSEAVPSSHIIVIRVLPTGPSRSDLVLGLPARVQVTQHTVSAGCGMAPTVNAEGVNSALEATMAITAFDENVIDSPDAGAAQGVYFSLQVAFSMSPGIDAHDLTALLEITNGVALRSRESEKCKSLETKIIGQVHLADPWRQNHTVVRAELPDLQSAAEAIYGHRPVAEIFAMDMLAMTNGHCTDKTDVLLIVMFSEPIVGFELSALKFGPGMFPLVSQVITGMSTSYHVYAEFNVSFTGRTYVQLRPDVVTDLGGASNLASATLELLRFHHLPMSQLASYHLNASNPYMRTP
ncbi:hypothetical protein CYMTET_51847 [Cymbomonas tetramitiformis]|uniref:LamG-like jellyroll fold domain-containing protein n=1 Tax=Cymbomonas tetramitiformis TaxID=36881 RepID=A0AAE0ERD9_9CHLO|nr:hypothetical protein CYMTET_51847 [Cymbomonas tetramitiformis]